MPAGPAAGAIPPLHHAVDRHSTFSADVVAALVGGGARDDLIGSSGETPLQLFARVGTNDGRIVHALIDGGADPNGKNPEGETPLHTAIRNGGNAENPKVVEALVTAGADPCIKDAVGCIPYNTAREGGTVHGMLANAGGHDRACDGAPEIVEADRRIRVSKRANLRSSPGMDYGRVGLPEAGEWLRIEAPDGGEASFTVRSWRRRPRPRGQLLQSIFNRFLCRQPGRLCMLVGTCEQARLPFLDFPFFSWLECDLVRAVYRRRRQRGRNAVGIERFCDACAYGILRPRQAALPMGRALLRRACH